MATNSNKQTTAIINADEITETGAVTICRNLCKRHDNETYALKVCPEPKAISDAGWHVIIAYTHPTGSAVAQSVFIYKKGTTESYTIAVLQNDNDISEICTVTGKPRCAVTLDRQIMLMLTTGQCRIVLDDDNANWHTEGDVSEIPKITIEAISYGTMSKSTESATITCTDLTAGDGLATGELKSLSTRLLNAYCDLASEAAYGGMWIQPVAVHYRVTGSDGTTLYQSTPTAVSPSGWQCSGEISVTTNRNDNRLTVPPMSISAEAFKLKITVPEPYRHNSSEWESATIEVFVSRQIHPVDLDANSAYRISQRTSTTPILTATLPGATSSMASKNRQRSSDLSSLMTLMPNGSDVATSITLPQTSSEIYISLQRPMPVKEEISAVKSLLNSITSETSTPTEQMISEITSPHSFTAATVSQNGDTVVWGDITTLPFTGYSPEDIGATFTDGYWESATSAELNDGSVLISRHSGSTRRPTSLSPIIIYPNPSARKLTIWITDANGSVGIATLQLTKTPDGKAAMYMNPTLENILLLPTTEQPPTTETTYGESTRKPGALIAASGTDPLIPLAATMIPGSTITSITTAVNSQSSWDFARSHLYVFTTSGIYAVNANNASRKISTSLIDPHPIVSENSVAYTNTGVMALSNGDLLRVSASRATIIQHATEATRIEWHMQNDELWMTDKSGNVTVRNTVNGHRHEKLLPISVEHIMSTGSHIYLTDNLTLMDASEEESDTTGSLTPIVWEAQAEVPQDKRAAGIRVDLSAMSFNGSIDIHAHNGAGKEHSLPVCELNVAGAVNAPIYATFVSPKRNRIIVRIAGNASKDFVLRKIELIFI